MRAQSLGVGLLCLAIFFLPGCYTTTVVKDVPRDALFNAVRRYRPEDILPGPRVSNIRYEEGRASGWTESQECSFSWDFGSRAESLVPFFTLGLLFVSKASHTIRVSPIEGAPSQYRIEARALSYWHVLYVIPIFWTDCDREQAMIDTLLAVARQTGD